MNMLLTKIEFGVKRFKSFRKTLTLDYKKGGKHAHKNPHAIPLETKQKLLHVIFVLFRPRKEEIGRKLENLRGRV